MNTTELAKALAQRTGVPQSTATQLLRALGDEITERLAAGDDVRVRGLGTFGRAWRARTSIRSLDTGRKVMIGGRYVARFKPSGRVRETLVQQSDASWRDEQHQAAWRLARTLISDVDAYATRRPSLAPATRSDEVSSMCEAVFGETWRQALSTYRSKASADPDATYLFDEARRAWPA